MTLILHTFPVLQAFFLAKLWVFVLPQVKILFDLTILLQPACGYFHFLYMLVYLFLTITLPVSHLSTLVTSFKGWFQSYHFKCTARSFLCESSFVLVYCRFITFDILFPLVNWSLLPFSKWFLIPSDSSCIYIHGISHPFLYRMITSVVSFP